MAYRKKETLFSDNSIYLENEKTKFTNDSPLVPNQSSLLTFNLLTLIVKISWLSSMRVVLSRCFMKNISFNQHTNL